ncbi:hypothetical protein MAFF301069_49550 (plasmid) [Ralstonia pseudosolanacearum]|nr:hypothetical protein MAFF301069_49550 [Ralstonia pseudosolanacearum]
MQQRESWKDNHKRVYHLYRAEGLSLRHKRPKRNKSARLRQPKSTVMGINEIWSMDFVSDALLDGQRLRALTVVDNYTRESLAIEVGQSLKGKDVVRVLDAVVAQHGTPQTIRWTMAPSSSRRRWTDREAISYRLVVMGCSPSARGRLVNQSRKKLTNRVQR